MIPIQWLQKPFISSHKTYQSSNRFFFFIRFFFCCFFCWLLQVVLSACSSYFQSLFLDHPSRHPIVILKDVRFAELRTLIEFMYKGEVNVQYCQLSALLKTAESLKVSVAFVAIARSLARSLKVHFYDLFM